MNEAAKSALISTFIYPGVGHLYLKKYVVGGFLAGVASWALFVLIGNILSRVVEVTDKIKSGQLAPDIAEIRQMLLSSQSEVSAEQIIVATTTLIIVWIIGIMDSYRLGRVKDLKTTKTGKP